MYRLASSAATTNTNTALTANYTYTDDLLTKITTGSTAYTFNYGNFDLRSNIKIGSRTLATYSYTSRTNYLSSLDYGNGDSVDYTYDKQGRIKKETYEDGDTVTYAYDNDGALASVKDSATGITTKYFYDFTDRLMKYTESNGHSVAYTYDTINNLTGVKETISGTARTTSYTYDKDNRVTKVTNGSAVESYTYDAYSRVSKRVAKNSSTTVLTDTITYRAPSSTSTTGQVATLKSAASGYNKTYTYGYDANGNITSVSDGTNTTTYVYDTANQLTRENNQAAGKTWVWAYDDAGNITSRKEYAYTTGTLGTATATASYTYDGTWGDLLTSYNGQTISSDTIGNMTSDGTWTYTWEHGRELMTMSNGSSTWTNTYNADGLRTKRTNGSTTYTYVYNGSSLSYMSVGSNKLYFTYDASGTPLSVTYNGTNYYYVTNLQGDVTAILNTSGTAVVTYTYDAWGNILSTGGSAASTLGAHNPLRYRGYVYDTDTNLYYLQSRYYDPEIGRFINADAFTSTGQGLLGNNMFVYCNNNPIMCTDHSGHWAVDWDLYHNQQAGREFTQWYVSTDGNEIGDDGKYTLDARIKRTYSSLLYNLEFSAGIGVGIGQKLEVINIGESLLCHYDFVAIQYCDGTWRVGDRLEMTASVSATQAYEFGGGIDCFRQNQVAVDPITWMVYNNKKESWTLVDFSNYNYFLGGNICIAFDLNTFLADTQKIWR